ncbi:MAG: S8 family serine peptidase [Pirellulaceae bacterium]
MLTSAGGIDIPALVDNGPEGETFTPQLVSGQVLVQFKPGTTHETIQRLLQQENATIVQSYYGMDNLKLINLSFYSQPASTITENTTKMAAANWAMKPEVASAQTNRYIADLRLTPDDTFYPFQWGLHNAAQSGGVMDADIDAREAWDIYTGSRQTVVAVIDSGVAYNHPDLRDNMWVNPGEIAGNLIDDDGNGYIDDVHGIAPAVAFNNGDPMDFNGHGTHVAGIIGAKGNNDRGVVGVNWNVSIMAVNIGEGPLGFTEGAIMAGITYVTMMKEQYGVNVVVSNNSWGGYVESVLERAAFTAQIDAGIVVVAAAGNDDSNNDAIRSYPDGYEMDGIIAVAASDPFDGRSTYSNYGSVTVDLFAPGGAGTDDAQDIYSTVPVFDDPSGYNFYAGTSMASPFVAGAVALIRGLAPELSVTEVKQLILDTVDVNPGLENYVLSGGRLNLYNALSQIESSHVQGTVWMDRNGDAVRNASEPGVANWTVYLDVNGNGVHNAGEPFDVTDASGFYDIQAFVPPGTYRVNQVLQPLWTQTYPAAGGHTITFGQRGDIVTGRDFGNMPLPGGVSGIKWNDLDGDGIKDPNEPGIGGVYIFADLDGSGTISLGEPASITAANGSYVINDIPAGLIAIREVLSPGWTLTAPALGYHLIDVQPNVSVPNVNFGNKTAFDFGDAPAPYPTLLSQGGASHGLLAGFHLGATVDAENNGLPTPMADGDDMLNLDDEDGVESSGILHAGTIATITVTATSTSRPAGYLQAWVDINRDGDWLDAGEHIIVDRQLATGEYDISFVVPANVTIGNTFARFRYSLEKGVGPAGHSTAGEVEDYAVLVLANEPVANPDSFEVLQNVLNAPLDVLANDFPSATRLPFIVSVTQPPRGTVMIAADQLSLIYTPNRGITSPPADEFTYTIGDGTGATSTATVSIFVLPAVLTPTAVDDTYRVSASSSDNQLQVLLNDLPGVLGTMQITTVTTPGSGTATVNNNGTPANPLDDFILYTPDGSFAGLDSFQYTIGNANGSSTATVTIFEDPSSVAPTVDISFEIEDILGNPITQINAGGEFVLIASIQDLRSVPANLAGIYAAYLDVLYDRSLVSPNFDSTNALEFEIIFSDEYSSFISGDISTPGLLNEVGAAPTDLFGLPLGPGRFELFRVVFTATAAGVAEFVGDPADETPDHDVLYYRPPSVVPLDSINYGLTSLTIVDPSRSVGTSVESLWQRLDINSDAAISPLDALLVINHLNATAGTFMSNPRLDVNRDTFVSPLDALLVINYLNFQDGEGGEGEGESDTGLLFVSGGDTASQLDLQAPLPVVTTNGTSSSGSSQRSALLGGTLVLPDAAADWQLQIGQSPDEAQGQPEAASLIDEPWESLLDTLAEDVLAAWLEGAQA